MASKIYGAVGVSGGSDGDLDNIDGTNLADLDAAVVISSTERVGIYWLDSDNAGVQAIPTLMTPDNNGGNKRWLLLGQNLSHISLYEPATTNKMDVSMSSGNVTFDNTYDTGTVTFKGENTGDSTMVVMDPAGAVEVYYGGTKEAETISGGFKATNSLQIAATTAVTGVLDEDNMVSNSDVSLATQQSIKAYADAHAALTEIHGATGAVVGTTNIQTLTNKTLTSPVLDGSLSGTAFLDEDNFASNSDVAVASQQSIKAYVDAKVTGEDLDFQGDAGGAQSVDLDSQTLTLEGGTGITTTGSAQKMSFAIDSTVATLTGSQVLTNKTLTSPVLNTGVSGTAIKDEDNMASNSASHLATQQSIKAYVDTNSGAFDSGTIMWFYQNTAPTGWTINGTATDRVLAIKGGSAAYNINGGLNGGTWTQTGHTHTGPSHTHTLSSHTHTGPSHTHTMSSHTHTGPSHSHSMQSHTHSMQSHTHSMQSHTHSGPSHNHMWYDYVSGASDKTYNSSGTSITYPAVTGITTLGIAAYVSGTHPGPNADCYTNNASGTTGGPSTASTGATSSASTGAASVTNTAADGTGATGGPSTANTGSGGTGASGTPSNNTSGSGGTGATGSGSEGNTYRPSAAVGIICSKD